MSLLSGLVSTRDCGFLPSVNPPEANDVTHLAPITDSDAGSVRKTLSAEISDQIAASCFVLCERDFKLDAR